MALGRPDQQHDAKPRLPQKAVVFKNTYQEQGEATIQAYDQVQADYAGARVTTTWSQLLAEQLGHLEHPDMASYLKEKKLL